MKKIFLIGDSIRFGAKGSPGYGVYVKKKLEGKAEVYLVADRGEAEAWLNNDTLERLAIEGAVATVGLEDGRRLLVGYSPHFGNEQPLRLEGLVSTSGRSLHDKPSVTLRLISHDTEFSNEIL